MCHKVTLSTLPFSPSYPLCALLLDQPKAKKCPKDGPFCVQYSVVRSGRYSNLVNFGPPVRDLTMRQLSGYEAKWPSAFVTVKPTNRPGGLEGGRKCSQHFFVRRELFGTATTGGRKTVPIIKGFFVLSHPGFRPCARWRLGSPGPPRSRTCTRRHRGCSVLERKEKKEGESQ